jgi:hypothetical protein
MSAGRERNVCINQEWRFALITWLRGAYAFSAYIGTGACLSATTYAHGECVVARNASPALIYAEKAYAGKAPGLRC